MPRASSNQLRQIRRQFILGRLTGLPQTYQFLRGGYRQRITKRYVIILAKPIEHST